MKIVVILMSLAIASTMCHAQALQPPRDSVPDDHLAWLGFHGPVKEVREYDYANYGKTIWKFDPQGRLMEYIDYDNPFFGSGGCVFGLWEHFRYAYDADGKIQFLETHNAENTVVDDYADIILELFPKQDKSAWLFPKAEKEYGDTTFCFSVWKNDGESSHYYGHRFDRYGNWIEIVSAELDDNSRPEVRVREICYYRDIEVMGLPVGVKTVKNQWKDDGKKWSNIYEFDRDGNLTHFKSWCEKDELYEWDHDTSEELGSDLIVWSPDENKKRKITYWK